MTLSSTAASHSQHPPTQAGTSHAAWRAVKASHAEDQESGCSTREITLYTDFSQQSQSVLDAQLNSHIS